MFNASVTSSCSSDEHESENQSFEAPIMAFHSGVFLFGAVAAVVRPSLARGLLGNTRMPNRSTRSKPASTGLPAVYKPSVAAEWTQSSRAVFFFEGELSKAVLPR